MLANVGLVIVGALLWFAVAHDAHAVEQRAGRPVWGLSNRTWAWIVAITFVGLVPYVFGRISTSRQGVPPPA